MYTSLQQVVHGLLKNATEGIAQPKLIGIFTVLLLGGQTLPIFSLGYAFYWRWSIVAVIILLAATFLSYIPRALSAVRFRQSWIGVLLNPLAIAVFVALQWRAMMSSIMGRPRKTWRGRA